MYRVDRFRVFAVCAALCLVVAGVVHVYLFDASEDAVSRSMRYDVSWAGANGRIEAAKLERHIARFAALGSEADLKAARLFYEILLSRLDTWDSGGFKKFMDRSPRRRVQFDALREKIVGLADDVAKLEQPAVRQRLLEAMAEIGPALDRVGAEAYTISVTEAATIRDEMHEKQVAQRWLIILLLIGGGTALLLMARQNRSLAKANSDIARKSDDLAFLATHDALTRLPNRRAFDTAFREALKAKRDDQTIAVVAIDLDGFKSVNEVLGHAAGDALLVGVAHLFAEEVKRADERNLLCRVGGDEFLALLWIDGDHPEQAVAIASRLLALLRTPIETSCGALMIGASVGVAVSAEDPSADEITITDADLALTEAKARGKGIALAFDPHMRADFDRRVRIERDLDRAIDAGEIVPHYQLQFDLASGRPVGFEALARWHHPELGWISPVEFVRIAENSGAVVKIGRMMLDIACRDASLLPEQIGVSVNLSVVQVLRDDIVTVVKDVLVKTGLDPARLTLEVTESVMMTDRDRVLAILRKLKHLGISISLDDFGTGYSALSYLTRFEWDELKIDRSFVESASRDPVNLTIIRTVKLLARKIGARVTAEGVETTEQRDLLRSIGCDTVQGYLYGRPVPAEELSATLLRHWADSLSDSDAYPPFPLERPARNRAPVGA